MHAFLLLVRANLAFPFLSATLPTKSPLFTLASTRLLYSRFRPLANQAKFIFHKSWSYIKTSTVECIDNLSRFDVPLMRHPRRSVRQEINQVSHATLKRTKESLSRSFEEIKNKRKKRKESGVARESRREGNDRGDCVWRARGTSRTKERASGEVL